MFLAEDFLSDLHKGIYLIFAVCIVHDIKGWFKLQCAHAAFA